jgi:hypothetical protein
MDSNTAADRYGKLQPGDLKDSLTVWLEYVTRDVVVRRSDQQVKPSLCGDQTRRAWHAFNWYAFREKENRIMRTKLKGLELVPNGMERCTGRTAPTRPLD